MKIVQKLIGICIILLVLSYAHSERHTHTTNQKESPHVETEHENQHNSKGTKDQERVPKTEENTRFNQQQMQNDKQKRFSLKSLLEEFLGGIDSKYVKVYLSVLVTSLPSVPLFLVLQVFSKLQNNKKTSATATPLSPTLLRYMMCLSTGALLGDVAFHIIPYLFEFIQSTHNEQSHQQHQHSFESLKIYMVLLAGILAFHILDTILSIDTPTNLPTQHHHHSHSNKTNNKEKHTNKNTNNTGNKSDQLPDGVRQRNQNQENIGNTRQSEVTEQKIDQEKIKENKGKNLGNQAMLFLLADFLHNFSDGLIIGNIFGAATTLVVAIEEIPHEIGDFAILVRNGYSLKQILITQFATALGSFFGSTIGLIWGEYGKEYVLAFTAGTFLYVCLAQLLPEIRLYENRKKGFGLDFLWEILLIVFGIVIMYCIALLD